MCMCIDVWWQSPPVARVQITAGGLSRGQDSGGPSTLSHLVIDKGLLARQPTDDLARRPVLVTDVAAAGGQLSTSNLRKSGLLRGLGLTIT